MQPVLAIASASPTIAICRVTPPADAAASTGGPLEPGAPPIVRWRGEAGIDTEVSRAVTSQREDRSLSGLIDIGVDRRVVAGILAGEHQAMGNLAKSDPVGASRQAGRRSTRPVAEVTSVARTSASLPKS